MTDSHYGLQARNHHGAFLKRNGAMVSAILAGSYPAIQPQALPLLEELTILVATNQVSAVLDGRVLRAWRHLFEAKPAGARASWHAGEWAFALRHRNAAADNGVPRRLFLLYRKLSRRSDFPSLDAMRKWGQPKWRSLFRSVGCSPDLAGTLSSLVLDRRELPGGPLTSHVYERMGFARRRGGRPSQRDVLPEDVNRLKWGFQQLAAFKCTPEVKPGSSVCSDCPVRAFCLAFRKARSVRQTNGIPFVDLFAGPGGMSLGFSKAGMRLILAVDKDRHAADTLYLNHPEAPRGVVVCRDVRGLLRNQSLLDELKGVPVVAGGPPCQAFSMARRHSRADRQDPRRHLVLDFVRVARQLDPLVVVMENVPGIRNARDGEAINSILRAFRRSGFVVDYRTLNTADYGIPQRRNRVFFIGVSRSRVHDANDVLRGILSRIESSAGKRMPPTVQQALNGLPHVRPGQGGMAVRGGVRGPRTTYARQVSGDGPLIFNHRARRHNPDDILIFEGLRWGETAREFDARRPGIIPYSLDSFGDKYRKLHPRRPSPTIPSHLKRDANSFVHPFIPRGITPREAARLQSFPDDHVFLGGFGSSFVQIGNAVPPILAEALGREVVRAVSRVP